MININKVTPKKFCEPAMLAYIFWVIPDTIDANINNDVPLEIPFSVISSPIHINITDPTVIVNAVATRFNGAVLIT